MTTVEAAAAAAMAVGSWRWRCQVGESQSYVYLKDTTRYPKVRGLGGKNNFRFPRNLPSNSELKGLFMLSDRLFMRVLNAW